MTITNTPSIKIFYINGVLNTEPEAQKTAKELKDKIYATFQISLPVEAHYNPSFSPANVGLAAFGGLSCGLVGMKIEQLLRGKDEDGQFWFLMGGILGAAAAQLRCAQEENEAERSLILKIIAAAQLQQYIFIVSHSQGTAMTGRMLLNLNSSVGGRRLARERIVVFNAGGVHLPRDLALDVHNLKHESDLIGQFASVFLRQDIPGPYYSVSGPCTDVFCHSMMPTYGGPTVETMAPYIYQLPSLGTIVNPHDYAPF